MSNNSNTHMWTNSAPGVSEATPLTAANPPLVRPPSPRIINAPRFVRLATVTFFSLLLFLSGFTLLFFKNYYKVSSAPPNDNGVPAFTSFQRSTTSTSRFFNQNLLSSNFFSKRAFPTGSFWTNLVLAGPSNQVVVPPYAIKWDDDQSQANLQISYSAARRTHTARSVSDIFAPDFTFVFPGFKRSVEHFSALSVTLQFTLDTDSFVSFPVCKGSPFISANFKKTKPILSALTEISKFQPLEDPRFSIIEQDDARWLLVSDGSLTFELDDDRKTLSSKSEYSGFLRIAILPPGSNPNLLETLKHFSSVVPLGGRVNIEFGEGERSRHNFFGEKNEHTRDEVLS